MKKYGILSKVLSNTQSWNDHNQKLKRKTIYENIKKWVLNFIYMCDCTYIMEFILENSRNTPLYILHTHNFEFAMLWYSVRLSSEKN